MPTRSECSGPDASAAKLGYGNGAGLTIQSGHEHPKSSTLSCSISLVNQKTGQRAEREVTLSIRESTDLSRRNLP